MNVLVACGFSGIVRDAFREKGHNAISCDLLPTETKGRHYQGDVMDLYLEEEWDLVLAFPPCTHLSSSGARWWKEKQDDGRQREAIEFARSFIEPPANVARCACENPVGILSTAVRRPDQIIQPWQYGHGETKSTCLWLHNLPQLVPSNEVAGRENRIHMMPGNKNQARNRSRTYVGVAKAMADQWG